MSIETTLYAAKTVQAVPVAPARYDIYAPIHRALRLFMSDTMVRVGRLDPEDTTQVHATLDQLDGLLAFCRAHLDHENRFVHPALEAARPGTAMRIAGEHVEHEEEIAALEAESATLRAAPGAQQALRLYRHLALFVAENMRHMAYEESAHNEVLWAAYSDAQIQDIEQRLVASIDQPEREVVLRWMTPALPPADRAAWLGALQAQMPPELFRGVLDAARAVLDDGAWAKLARALGLPPVPGLMTV